MSVQITFYGVDEVTILEPFEQPTDNEILSQIMQSDNTHHSLIFGLEYN